MSVEIRRKMLDKGYHTKSWNEILHSPVSAINGVSMSDQGLFESAFRIKTIKDLAENKFFRIALTISTLAEIENLES